MTASLSDIVIPSLAARLGTVLGMLEKSAAHAEAKGIDPIALLEARLRPDMFSFTGQIEAIGDAIRRGIERMAGKEPTSVDSPKPTFEALTAYMQDTLKCVQGADKVAIDAYAETKFPVPFGPTMTMEFSGHSYAFAFLLPNTMFHVSTAYAILRERGVELGKIDLLGSFVQHFDVKPLPQPAE
jgi:hypothetical protein